MGELELTRDGARVADPSFLAEAGGFTYFGALRGVRAAATRVG